MKDSVVAVAMLMLMLVLAIEMFTMDDRVGQRVSAQTGISEKGARSAVAVNRTATGRW